MRAIKTRLTKIGNAQVLRIPKAILEQLDLSEEVLLEVEEDKLVVRPLTSPRSNWDDQYKEMAAKGDDQFLDEGVPSLTSWDEEEWEW